MITNLRMELFEALVPDDDNHDANVEEGHTEAGPAAALAWGRARGEDDLEAEGEEVHEIVWEGGGVQVAAVDEHGGLDLLGPAALVEAELAELGLGHGDHVVHDLRVLVVVGDGDRGAWDWTELGPLRSGASKLK